MNQSNVNVLLLTHVRLRCFDTMRILNIYILNTWKYWLPAFRKNAHSLKFSVFFFQEQIIFFPIAQNAVEQNDSEAIHRPGVVFEPPEQIGRMFFGAVATFRSSSSPYTFWNAAVLGVVCIKNKPSHSFHLSDAKEMGSRQRNRTMERRVSLVSAGRK